MTQKEIAQAALSWRKEDEDNRAVIVILVDNKGNDSVATSLTGLDMYAYALSRLFKNSELAPIAAMAALKFVGKKKDYED